MSYVYISITILLTVYGQMAIKWQVLRAGTFPDNNAEKLGFILHLLLNPWVISAFVAALLASVAWMVAMTKLPLSHAYPFMSLAFVFVMGFSGLLFHEAITFPKIIGIIFVIVGLIIGSQG
ncbi:MAG: EamA family transporter [Burkholderiaceae bacterium]|nr:EamA family transporter [Burkholderiaceae bacterium]MDZ4143685.1 EamA family transporter [Burkholderiales bacterium]